VPAVPEPSALPLLATCVVGVAGIAFRRKSSRSKPRSSAFEE
jgi:hypothetical protein